MATEAGHDDREANQNTVFIDTSLDTHLATIVSDSDTVSDLKKKIILEHLHCFPAIGDIKIHCLKVKRRGNFYHLSDSMLVKSAFGSAKKNWFVTVDASRIEQYDGTQNLDKHKAGNQLALPWVTDSRSIDRHDDSHADRPSKLSLIHGSPLVHPKIVPFVNQKVPSVDQLTSGDSCKDVSKNIVEDRSSNDDHWRNPEPDLEKQLGSNVQEKLYDINKEIKSKKRNRNVHNKSLLEDASGSGLSVKKKHKTQIIKSNVKGLEENRVVTCDTDMVKHKGTTINDENSFENKSKNKDENCSVLDQVAIVVPSIVEYVREETLPQKNTEASETVPDVAMVVEKNIQQDSPFGVYQKENDNELVQKTAIGNEIPSSSIRTSDCEHDPRGVTAVGHQKGAKHEADEKEVSSTSFINKLDNIIKDVIDSSHQDVGQEFAGDQIDKHKEDREVSINQGPEVKLPEKSKETMGKKRKTKKSAAKNKDDNPVGDISSTVPEVERNETLIDNSVVYASKKSDDVIDKRKKSKKSAAKNKDELLGKHVDNPVGDTSSTVSATVFDEKIIDERKNEVLEKTLIDDSRKKSDDVIVKEVKFSEPTEIHRSQMEEISRKELKDTVGSRRKKKDVGKSASRNLESVVKHTNDNDAATVTTERKESREITSIDVEKNTSQVNAQGINDSSEKQNEIDGTKKNKKKKKSKKSDVRNENESIMKYDNGDLQENAKEAESSLPDANRKDEKIDDVSQVGVDVGTDAQNVDEGLVRKPKKSPKSSVRAHSDLPEKSQSLVPEETSKNLTLSEVSKGSKEVDIPKDRSHEIDFMHYFVPGKPNNIASVENGRNTARSGREKKPMKKTKEQDDSSQKLISKNEKASTDVVKDPPNNPNIDQIKTPKRTRKIDVPRTSKSGLAANNKGPSAESSSSSESFGHNQKNNKQQSIAGQAHLKKSAAPVVKKSLLNKPGTIFADDSDESSADDNAAVNSDSTTRTPSAKKSSSSSSGESDSSIDSRRNGSCALKRKEDGGKNSVNSQSKMKNISMAEFLRSSSRFKKAKMSASSQQVDDTESQHVDFVPESQPTMSKR